MNPTDESLMEAISSATHAAVTKLFSNRREHFYYCALITSGDAQAPVLTAWSREALAVAVRNQVHPETAERSLKWSYMDSPYYAFAEDEFQTVRELFSLRPRMTPSLTKLEWHAEYEYRLGAMEAAMADLDRRGIFGSGEDRLNMVINVEVMPPDFTNTLRAGRLNPPAALTRWLVEAAEKA